MKHYVWLGQLSSNEEVLGDLLRFFFLGRGMRHYQGIILKFLFVCVLLWSDFSVTYASGRVSELKRLLQSSVGRLVLMSDEGRYLLRELKVYHTGTGMDYRALSASKYQTVTDAVGGELLQVLQKNEIAVFGDELAHELKFIEEQIEAYRRARVKFLKRKGNFKELETFTARANDAQLSEVEKVLVEVLAKKRLRLRTKKGELWGKLHGKRRFSLAAAGASDEGVGFGTKNRFFLADEADELTQIKPKDAVALEEARYLEQVSSPWKRGMRQIRKTFESTQNCLKTQPRDQNEDKNFKTYLLGSIGISESMLLAGYVIYAAGEKEVNWWQLPVDMLVTAAANTWAAYSMRGQMTVKTRWIKLAQVNAGRVVIDATLYKLDPVGRAVRGDEFEDPLVEQVRDRAAFNMAYSLFAVPKSAMIYQFANGVMCLSPHSQFVKVAQTAVRLAFSAGESYFYFKLRDQFVPQAEEYLQAQEEE